MALRTEAHTIEHPATPSFELFFAEAYEPILRAMYLVIGDRDEAEDLTQEALCRVYARWDRVRGTSNPIGYAYRAAFNAHRSRIRRLAVATRRALRPVAEDAIAAAEDRHVIRRALAALPRGQREALVLVEWVGLTDREAARVLGIRPEALRMRTSRARRRLREELSDGPSES